MRLFDPESSWFNRWTGGGKKPKLPPQPAPAPTPQSIQEGAELAGTREARIRKRQKGRRSLILTEQGLGSTTVERQSLLGNTGA